MESKTRVTITAQAPNPILGWDTSAQRAERARRDPFAPLRSVCSPPTAIHRQKALEGEPKTGRPHFWSEAEFHVGDEFAAFMAAINMCTLDDLIIRLEDGGAFPNVHEFRVAFLLQLQTGFRHLKIETLSSSLYRLNPKVASPSEAKHQLVHNWEMHRIHMGFSGITPYRWRTQGGAASSPEVPKTTDLWEHDITSPKYARFQIGATKHLWVSKWRHEHLPWLMMVEIMRSLCLARMLLHAQRSERTNITHLPAHIINDIVVQASRNPAAIIPRQWRVLLRYAEDRDAQLAVAHEIQHLYRTVEFDLGWRVPDRERVDLFMAEWLFNGGFWASFDGPERSLKGYKDGDFVARTG